MMAEYTDARMMSRRGFLTLAGACGAALLGAGTLIGCSAPDAGGASASAAGGVTKVKVVAGNGAPPYCYLDKSGNLVGYDVDVLKAVDERLKDYEFSIDGMEFNAMITACQSGAADLVSCQLVPNEERKSKFIFCNEAFCLSPMVFAVRDPNIKTLDDMAGKTVSGNPANYEYGMLEAYNKKYPEKAVVLKTSNSTTVADAFKLVASGQVDGTLSYDGMFDTVNSEAKTGLYKTNVVICESTYFMLHKGQEKLRDAIDGVLKKMKKDGSLAKISEKDLGVDVFTKYADALSDNQLVG